MSVAWSRAKSEMLCHPWHGLLLHFKPPFNNFYSLPDFPRTILRSFPAYHALSSSATNIRNPYLVETSRPQARMVHIILSECIIISMGLLTTWEGPSACYPEMSRIPTNFNQLAMVRQLVSNPKTTYWRACFRFSTRHIFHGTMIPLDCMWPRNNSLIMEG